MKEFNGKDFNGIAIDTYFAMQGKTPDWEQDYFNKMEEEFNTKTCQTLCHIFYWDDDTIGDTAEGVLEDLEGEKLIKFTCFDDDVYQCATIVVAIVEKHKKD